MKRAAVTTAAALFMLKARAESACGAMNSK
jgi:hypothetical protein